MKSNIFKLSLLLCILSFLASCQSKSSKKEDTESGPPESSIRQPVDTVGFAQYGWQMDSIMARIERIQGNKIISPEKEAAGWRLAISPHDDYAYVGYLYPSVLKNIRAKTILLFGVAHKARKLNLENKIIFDHFDFGKEPYGNVRVSAIRNEIIEQLPKEIYEINDSMQQIEHSVEAIIPFLQNANPHLEIVSILVPYMSFVTMETIAGPLASAIQSVLEKRNWKWGRDLAMIISTDAVHYGDQDWGGKNFAFNGIGDEAYQKTKTHEHEIMSSITGNLLPEGIRKFTEYTVMKEDYRAYKWTWCGRYSVPLGLLTAFELQQRMSSPPLFGTAIGYSTSIEQKPLPVDDIRMGITASANSHHWVGYAGIGYK